MLEKIKDGKEGHREPQVLRLEGAVDLENSQELSKSIEGLVDRGHIHIALDFSKVDVVSSAAVRILIDKTKALEKLKGKLVLFGVHGDVMEIFKLAGFEKILHISSEEQEALKAFRP